MPSHPYPHAEHSGQAGFSGDGLFNFRELVLRIFRLVDIGEKGDSVFWECFYYIIVFGKEV